MIDAFTRFRNSLEAKRSLAKYEEMPFTFVLDRARKEDKDALYYLILQNMGPITKAYFKYYVRPLQLHGEERIEQSHDCFNSYLVTLYSFTKNKKGPIFSFNPNVFEQQDDAFLFNKFSYYLYRYFEAFLRHLVTKERLENSHNSSSSEYEDELPDEKTSGWSPSSNKIDFINYLKTRYSNKPYYSKILFYLTKNYSAQDIAEEMHVSKKYIYMKINDIKKMYAEWMSNH